MSAERRPLPAGLDPIDSELGERLGPVPRPRLARWPRRHLALGLGPSLAPTIVFVPLGVLLGPQVLGVLGDRVLGHLDAVVSVALAVLGVIAGLAFGRRAPAPRLLAAAVIQGSVTAAIVFGAAVLLLAGWRMPADVGTWLAALCLALGASPSSAPAEGHGQAAAAAVADVDDLVPIVGSGVLLASVSPVASAGPVVLLGATIGVGAAAAVLAGLLLPDSRHPSERIVFVVGVLLLLGGAAAYLSLSPLLAGLVAGFAWSRMGPDVGGRLVLDLLRLQHPLVVLLLLVAGAGSALTLQALWLTAAFVLCRLTGKLVGGWSAAKAAGGLVPGDVGMLLLSPGMLGVAVVLNVQQSMASGTVAAVLTAVSLGAVVFEALVLALPEHLEEPGGRREAAGAEPRVEQRDA